MTDDTRGNTPDPRLPSDATIPSDSQPGPGRALGPYVLRELIGSGGMGEVWRADQTSPVKRTVALKLIKAGMDSREVLTRFEAERQALALMDHPSIAKIFDAGMTQQGRPYFAMEYVKGVPLTQYCDRRRLNTRERLRLFQQICQGVQHAHQKAVLHRDLKPGNVLVTDLDDKPQPKIIDFGVAKATTQKLTEQTMYTALGQLIGTPEYMSPEQAELTGEDVDTRTDVYSLGVILYELLSGALPFAPEELRKAGFEGIIRVLRNQDPPRPSTKISTLGERATQVAKDRSVELRKLTGQLRGDMDWIVMRCLEKDRNRRYGSPQELAQDIERHLKDEPVLAGPPSATYRTRKFIRRHRLGVTIAAATLVVLVGFAATMAVQSQRIADERDRANLEAEASERVSDFLADMLGDVDPARLGNTLVKELEDRIMQARKSTGASEAESAEEVARFEYAIQGISRADVARHLLDREILSRAATSIEELADTPLIAARLHHALSQTCGDLGLQERAEEQTLLGLRIRERELGSDHLKTLSSQLQLAGIYQSTYRIQENADLSSQCIDVLLETVGLEHVLTARFIAKLAAAYHNLGRIVESDSLYTLSRELRMRLLGPDHPETLRSMQLSGDLAMHMDRDAEAESLLTVALEKYERILGPDHKQTLWTRNFLAYHYKDEGRADEAITLLSENVERHARSKGIDHPITIYFNLNVGQMLVQIGRYEEAEPILLDVLERARRTLGLTHREVLSSLSSLASLYTETNRIQEKDAFFEDMMSTLIAAAREPDLSRMRKITVARDLLDVVPASFVDPHLPLQLLLDANEDGKLGSEDQARLARAYFRANMLSEAVETQREALEALPEGESDQEMDAALVRYEQALLDSGR